MRALLDSNAYSRLITGDDQTAAVVRGATEILMSAVVVGELLYGFRNGSRFDRNVADLRSFLDNPYVSFVPVGPTTADRYSRIAAALRAKGNPSRPTTCGLRPTPWKREPTWCRRTGISRLWTASRGCGWAAGADRGARRLMGNV